jgi:hypothetical protein
MRVPAYLFAVAAMGAATGAEDEPAHLLAKVDAQRVAQAEAALRAELDALAAGPIGPIVLTEERFTKKLADGSVQVSQYWGRAPMQAYPFFEAYDLLGDKKYLRAALDLADYYLRIQEPEGFWHYAHIVKPDGTARRLELAEAKGRAVCRIQDTHQTGCFRLMLYAWRVTGEAKYLAAARRCGDYLLSIQNENGSWPDWWIPGHKHTDPNPRPKAGVISGGSYNDGATTGGLEVYRHDQPEKWPKEFPQKHDGIQKFTRDNGGPGGAPHFLAAWRQGGREALRAKFSGSVKLSPEEYERTRLSAAKWVASQRDAPRSPAQFLLKLRTAQGRFTPEQLAPAAPPHFCGQGLHSFKAANWFDIPWRQ